MRRVAWRTSSALLRAGLLLLVGAVPARAQCGYVVSTSVFANPATTTATTSGVDTSGADLVVIAVAYYAGAGQANLPATDITDSKSNTYTALTNYKVASGGNNADALKLFYKLSPSVGASHTVTVADGSGIYHSIGVLALSGASAGFDVENGNAPTTTANTSMTTGSITPSVANDCIVAAYSDGASNAGESINSSFTIRRSMAGSAGVNYGIILATLFQGAAAAVNPSYSATSPDLRVGAIAAFKSTGGGASPTPCRLLLLGVGCGGD